MSPTPTPPPPPPSDPVTEDESPGQRTVEVAIPNVGTFVIESEEGGYDDEVALALCLCDIRAPLLPVTWL